MKRTVCVYHSIDLDGWMSAAIVKHWWKSLYYDSNNVHDTEENGSLLLRGNFSNEEQERLDFIGYNYGQPIPDLSEYDKVIMCDISFPKEEMEKLKNHSIFNPSPVYIDHHISAIKDLGIDNENSFAPKYEGIQNTNFAACELTWQYFFPNEIIPEIVRLLGMYDSFRHKNTDEELKVLEFQYGARQCISNYEEAYKYLRLSIDTKNIKYNNVLTVEESILEQGKSIYSYLCIEANQVYKNGFPIEFIFEEEEVNCSCKYHEYKFICINKERFNPINFGIEYHKYGYDGAACFHFDGTNYNFSLYNDNGLVDCSIIAKQYGGGGHAGASGMRLTPEQFNNLISI